MRGFQRLRHQQHARRCLRQDQGIAGRWRVTIQRHIARPQREDRQLCDNQFETKRQLQCDRFSAFYALRTQPSTHLHRGLLQFAIGHGVVSVAQSHLCRALLAVR